MSLDKKRLFADGKEAWNGWFYWERDVKTAIKELKANCKTRVKYNMECKHAINQEDKCKFCKKIDEVFRPTLVEEKKRCKTYTDPKLESEDGVEEEKR